MSDPTTARPDEPWSAERLVTPASSGPPASPATAYQPPVWQEPPVIQVATADPITKPLVAPANSLTQPPANALSQPAVANSLTQPPVNALTQAPPSPVPQPGGPGARGRVPAKGELDIHERRTWRTWQLLVAVLVAVGLGMWFNGATSSSGTGSASGSASHGTYHLPPAASQSPSGTSSPGGGSSATTTTAAGGTTTTTAAGGSTATTTASATGTPTVLIPQTTQSGNWTSAPFNIASGTWNIGWAFQCTPAPATAPTFAIFVVNAGGSPGSTPAVTSPAASGQSVTPETSTGSQQVIVQTAASCRWAVKVTGIGG